MVMNLSMDIESMNKFIELKEKMQCTCARNHLTENKFCHNIINKPDFSKGMKIRLEETICNSCLNNCLED